MYSLRKASLASIDSLCAASIESGDANECDDLLRIHEEVREAERQSHLIPHPFNAALIHSLQQEANTLRATGEELAGSGLEGRITHEHFLPSGPQIPPTSQDHSSAAEQAPGLEAAHRVSQAAAASGTFPEGVAGHASSLEPSTSEPPVFFEDLFPEFKPLKYPFSPGR